MVKKEQPSVQHAEFLFGAPALSAIRKQNLPEVAVIGRSNVGKSTFINRLTGRKLARVSGRPGSTTELNFYRVTGQFQDNPFAISLVDIPGFGFAKLSKYEREHISRLSVTFLRERKQLHAVVLLNDCRRAPQEDELAIQELCANEGLMCLVVLTKFDTLRQNDKAKALRAVAEAYRLEAGDVLCTGEGISPAPIWERLLAIL